MTLCVVWRADQNVHFASDSLLTFGSEGTTDCGIKVVRIPYKVYGPSDGNHADTLAAGDLGMAFAGSAVSALMFKEALAELLFSVQAVPGHTDYSMQGIADLVFRAYSVVSDRICSIIRQGGLTCIVIAGYCSKTLRHRAFRMETDAQNRRSCQEILQTPNSFEVFGSGATAALKLIKSADEKQILEAVRSVIGDGQVPSVGGSLQYGKFRGSHFQPMGIAEFDGDDVHYWRGPLDFNGSDFDQSGGLVPNFPVLDFIRKER